MKKYVILAVALVSLLSLAIVVTSPQDHGWQRIYDGTLGDNGNQDTTSAFALKGWEGVITLVIETDTTSASTLLANQSDSCLTVFVQLYRLYTDPNDGSTDGDWMGYYSAADTFQTRIDSISRTYVNKVAKAYYMNPAVLLNSNGEWGWADSARFILSIGTGDSLLCKVDVGGQ
jgi:hypothetical protein